MPRQVLKLSRVINRLKKVTKKVLATEVIKNKRNGRELDPVVIQDFISKYVTGEVVDYQMSAFLMAVFFNGMTRKRTLGTH